MLAHWRVSLKFSLLLLWIISFIFSIWLVSSLHEATFYLLPFRAWELLTGSILAIYALDNGYEFNLHPAVTWVGLGLIIFGVFGLEPGAHFPGVWAVPPVLGTLLLIANGRSDNLVNRGLSLRPVVAIGLISYSLYLWYWPIITLWKYYFGPMTSISYDVILLTLIFGFSFVSWRFVELPFRHTGRISNLGIVTATVTTSSFILVLGGWIYLSAGLKQRFDSDVQTHIAASQDFLRDWSRCETSTDGALANIEVCKLGPNDKPPTFLAWGDSHLRAYKEGIALAARESGTAGLLIWRAGCPPLFSIKKRESASTRQQDVDCEAANAQIRSAMKEFSNIKTVLLLGRWSYYVEGGGVGLDAHNTIKVESKVSAGAAAQHETIGRALQETIRIFDKYQKRVIVLRQIPEFPQFDSRLLAKQFAHGRKLPARGSLSPSLIGRAQAEDRAGRADQILESAANNGSVTLLDPWPMICDAKRCSASRAEGLLYFDNNHLTNFGARALRQVFAPLLAAIR